MSTQRQQSRQGAMAAQLEVLHQQRESSKSSRNGNANDGQLRGEPPHSTYFMEHDVDDHAPPKKSVLAKVKEKAQKWRNTLSKKKKNEDSNTTPSWGVSLEDDEDEDPEYLGAPMYESEMAPEGCKEAARQHPRAIPVIPENHVLPRNPNSEAKKPEKLDQTVSETEKKSGNDVQPDAVKTTKTSAEVVAENTTKTLSESVSEKLEPAYTTISTFETLPRVSVNTAERSPGAVDHKGPSSSAAKPEAPVSAPAALDRIAQEKSRASAAPDEHPSANELNSDKEISVKEFITLKLEPGEDERALSQVISETISPMGKAGKVSVAEKVRESLTSLLQNEETSNNSQHEVVEEENQGRILQAN